MSHDYIIPTSHLEPTPLVPPLPANTLELLDVHIWNIDRSSNRNVSPDPDGTKLDDGAREITYFRDINDGGKVKFYLGTTSAGNWNVISWKANKLGVGIYDADTDMLLSNISQANNGSTTGRYPGRANYFNVNIDIETGNGISMFSDTQASAPYMTSLTFDSNLNTRNFNSSRFNIVNSSTTWNKLFAYLTYSGGSGLNSRDWLLQRTDTTNDTENIIEPGNPLLNNDDRYRNIPGEIIPTANWNSSSSAYSYIFEYNYWIYSYYKTSSTNTYPWHTWVIRRTNMLNTSQVEYYDLVSESWIDTVPEILGRFQFTGNANYYPVQSTNCIYMQCVSHSDFLDYVGSTSPSNPTLPSSLERYIYRIDKTTGKLNRYGIYSQLYQNMPQQYKDLDWGEIGSNQKGIDETRKFIGNYTYIAVHTDDEHLRLCSAWYSDTDSGVTNLRWQYDVKFRMGT